MKKSLLLLTVLSLCVSCLAGCGQTQDQPDAAQEESQEQEQEQNQEQNTEEASYANMLEEILGTGKITMAVSPDYAPYEFVDLTKEGPESYVGADIELGKYIADKLGVELEIRTMDFESIQAAVTTGSVNMAISALAYSEDRAENMGLSTEYKLGREEKRGVLVAADEAANYKTAEDFSGKTIAVQNGTLQYELVTTQLPEDVKLQLVSSMKDAILMLTSGRVDGVAGTDTYSENYPEIALSEFLFDYDVGGNVIAVPKEETELLEALNEIVEEVNEAGIYGDWVEEGYALADSLGLETA